MNCECWFHRYHVVHIVGDQILDHAQGTWDIRLRGLTDEQVETYSSELYRHGMTAEQLRVAASRAEGRSPIGHELLEELHDGNPGLGSDEIQEYADRIQDAGDRGNYVEALEIIQEALWGKKQETSNVP